MDARLAPRCFYLARAPTSSHKTVLRSILDTPDTYRRYFRIRYGLVSDTYRRYSYEGLAFTQISKKFTRTKALHETLHEALHEAFI